MQKSFFPSSMAFILVISAIAFQAPAVMAAPAKACHAIFGELETVNFRQGVTEYDAFRANANDFWSWARRSSSPYLSKDLMTEGLVTGDPHGLNFGDLYLSGQRTKVTLVDIDDAGRGPFILDFARLLISIKLSASTLKAPEIWEAYLDGLFGRKYEAPLFVDDVMEKTHQDWLSEQVDFVAKNSVGDRLNKESLELKPLSLLSREDQERAKRLIAKISEMDPQAVVKDAAFKVKETGGSQGMLRIWVLVEKKGARSINEFKEMAPPATKYFESQLNQKERMDEVTQVFWGVRDPAEYKVVSIPGGDFWLRPRYKYGLKFNSEKMDSEKKIKKYDEWSLYIAYVLGRLHSSQKESTELRHNIKKQGEDQVLDQIKALTKSYRQHIEAN